MDLRGRLYCLSALALGRSWQRCLREIEESPAAEIAGQSLASLLSHAVANVPYYRDLGIPENRLAAFPLLSRRTLRTQFARLKSDDIDSRRWRRTSTGGSTGEPVWILQDQDFLAWDYATEMYCTRAFRGMPYREYLRSRRVAIWHRRRLCPSANFMKRLGVRLIGQVIYVEPYLVYSEERLTTQLRRINRHRPEVILAFAGTAYQLARHARRMGIAMHRPRFVVTSVEMLFPPMRETIQDVFGCPVYNQYGAAEVGTVASECSQGSLHLLSFANHVEVLNPDGSPTPPGEVGRIVVTPLHNLAMPLIRYDIGDVARVSSRPCTCGSPLPTLGEIQGRIVHQFVRPDGRLVFGGNFIAMFYEHDWIAEFYILQEDVDRIRIIYTRAPGRSIPEGATDRLTRVVRRMMGDGCHVVWEEGGLIPKSPYGRHLHARSLVWEKRVGSELPADDRDDPIADTR